MTNSTFNDRLIQISQRLRHESETLTAPSALGVYKWGEQPVVISASHATPHFRLGREKGAEAKTGALALELGRALGGTSILPLIPQQDDPNFDLDESAPYKTALAKLLTEQSLLIDVHGMRDGAGADLCIGTGAARPIPAAVNSVCRSLRTAFDQAKLVGQIDEPFDARHPGTIAAFGRTRCSVSLQLELSISARTPPRLATTFTALVAALSD